MPSTLADHLASAENDAVATECAVNAIEGDQLDSKLEGIAGDDPANDTSVDCHPSCGLRLDDLQSRITQIERQLQQLLSQDRELVAQPTEPQKFSEGPGEQCAKSRGTGEEYDSDEEHAWTEIPVATAASVGVDDAAESVKASETPSAPTGPHDPSDLPTWAQAYQTDDGDDSVKEYVERLLQRMAGNEDQRSTVPQTSVDREPNAHLHERPNSFYDAARSAARQNASSREQDTSSRETVSTNGPLHTHPSGCEAVVKNAPTAEHSNRQSGQVVPTPEATRASREDTHLEPSGYAPAEPYAPRSLPPERLANLAEMRELANISATAAIRSFEKGRAAKHAVDRLPLLMTGLSCGLFLLYFATTGDGRMMQLLLYAGAGLSFLAAAVAAEQAISVLFRWMARGKEDEDAAAS